MHPTTMQMIAAERLADLSRAIQQQAPQAAPVRRPRRRPLKRLLRLPAGAAR
jgi:hypothetical protein